MEIHWFRIYQGTQVCTFEVCTFWSTLHLWSSEATYHAGSHPRQTQMSACLVLYFLIWFDILLIQFPWLSKKKKKGQNTGSKNKIIITRVWIQKLEIPTVYFLLFVTTEMLKHLNTEKSWMTSSLASQFSFFFSFFFFICLAITTDDIARHWESSSKAWETAMTNQVMRHGVIHLRVTPTVLPLWHTRTHTHTHPHARTHPPILKTEEALWVEKALRKKEIKVAQGWWEQWDFILKCKCKMNYYCNLLLYVLWRQICLFIKTLQASLCMNRWRTPLCGWETSSPA